MVPLAPFANATDMTIGVYSATNEVYFNYLPSSQNRCCPGHSAIPSVGGPQRPWCYSSAPKSPRD